MARIAIILGRLVIGGTTTDTLQVAQHLQHHHDVLLVTGGGQKNEFEAAFLTQNLPLVRHERINGFAGKLNPFVDVAAIYKLRRILKKFNPDIVHSHTAKAGILGRLAAKSLPNAKVLHTYHGLIFSGYYNSFLSKCIVKLEQYLSRYTDQIIALSPGQKNQLVNDYKIADETAIAIVPLGIDVDRFAIDDDTKRAKFRNRFQLHKDQIAIGIIGRLVPVKNHQLFLDVAFKTLQTHKQVRFFIIGDGILRKKLLDYCMELGLNNTFFPENPVPADIIFTSWITEVDLAISGLDIVMLTSHNEGTPVSLMEAQAGALPVITTNAGGTHDIVLHGQTGFIAANGSVTELVDQLLLLVDNNQMRQQMGAKGRTYAIANFQKLRQVQNLDELYRKLIGKV